MRIISAKESFSSSSYTNGRRMFRKLWVSILLVILVYLAFYIYFFSQKYYWFIILGAIFLFTSVFINKDYKNFIKKIKNWKKGVDGEVEVQKLLSSNFDDRFTLITNFTFSNQIIGDIDAILVGPKGLFILEVKKWSGKFRISYLDFFRRLYNNQYLLYKNVFKQINNQKNSLVEYLTVKGINVSPVPLLVLVDGKIDQIVGNPGIYTIEFDKLVAHLNNFKDRDDFTLEFCNQIVSTFKK